MADVVGNVHVWNERVQQFKELANMTDAEFNWKKFPDGKEVVEAQLFYRPAKGEGKNG